VNPNAAAMVHLASVANDSAVEKPLVEGLEKIKLEAPPMNAVSASVYGCRFAAEGLPDHSMPDVEM
jgi:hypothetical protein